MNCPHVFTVYFLVLLNFLLFQGPPGPRGPKVL